MKKIIATILSTVLVIGCISTSAFAAEPKVVTGSAEGKAGETVTISLMVENNPGISGIVVVPTYNEDVLTLNKNSVKSDVFPSKQIGLKIFLYNDGNNVNGDCTICTMEFAISDTAAAGDYEIKMDFQEAYNEDFDNVDFTTVSGKITVQSSEPQPSATFDKASLNIGADLSLTVTATVENITTPKIKFSMGEGESLREVTKDMTSRGSGLYEATYDGITAKCMADELTMQILDDDGEKVNELEYSVKQYCKNLYNSTAADLKISDEKKAALDILCANMLTYGAKTQNFDDYNTTNLADADDWVADAIEDYGKTEPPTSVKGVTSAATGNEKINSAYVRLGKDVKIGFYINSNDATNEKLVVYYGEKTDANKVEYSLGNPIEVEPGVYKYEVICRGMTAREFSKTITAALVNGSTTLHEVTYSVYSYASSKWNDSDSKLESAVRWIYNYGQAAEAYATAK